MTLIKIAQNARKAALDLAALSSARKVKVLKAMAQELRLNRAAIKRENRRDLAQAERWCEVPETRQLLWE